MVISIAITPPRIVPTMRWITLSIVPPKFGFSTTSTVTTPNSRAANADLRDRRRDRYRSSEPDRVPESDRLKREIAPKDRKIAGRLTFPWPTGGGRNGIRQATRRQVPNDFSVGSNQV